MLLWVVATHHCVFEQIASEFHKQPPSQASHSTSDSSSNCPSHPVGDPTSHSEGESCGTVIQANSTIRDASQTLTPVLGVIVKLVFDDFSYQQTHTTSLYPSWDESSASIEQLANSLSIAPNAPPVALA